MPRSVIHTPWDLADAKQVGARMFRKQLLPLGKIEHEGETLDFTKELLGKFASNFTAGSRDQVPLVLVDKDNKHVSDPEKYRGDIKAMELADDGLYVTAELSEDGAKLVHANPKLGVSARIDRAAEDIEHVAATLNPVIKGMKPWEAVELSDSDDVEVLDLSVLQFAEASGPPAPTHSPPVTEPATKTTDLSADDAQRIFEQIIADAKKGEKDPPVANLSEADRKAIELATQNANDASERARAAEAKLAESEFNRTRDQLVAAGVPPADVDLAAPVLKGDKGTIELSNGSKVDAREVITKLLEQRKGTVDLSGPIGVGSGAEGSQEAEAKAAAEAWAKSNGGGE